MKACEAGPAPSFLRQAAAACVAGTLLAMPAAAFGADGGGWSAQQLLLLALVVVSVVLVAGAYVVIARKAGPAPKSVPAVPVVPTVLPVPSMPPTPASPVPSGELPSRPSSAPLPVSSPAPPVPALPAESGVTAIVGGPGTGSAFATSATDRVLDDRLLAAVELRASHGPLAGQVFPLPTPHGALAIAVGRDAGSCQLVFPDQPDSQVGRLHCMLIWNPGALSLVVEDAGSGHGSYVNARRVAPHEATPLQDGDVIDLGGVASNRLSVRLLVTGEPPHAARCVQCTARGHLHFAEPGPATPCPVCATMRHETLVTRARQDAGTTIAPVPNMDQGAAAAPMDIAPAVQPAVGWLMCTHGPDRGRDFRLVAGYNAIGRGDEMPVRLAGDGAVQRQQHAVVEFDPLQQQFFLRPGDNRGLVYLNGEELVRPMPMLAQDRIELGSSTLILVPLAAPGEWASMDLPL